MWLYAFMIIKLYCTLAGEYSLLRGIFEIEAYAALKYKKIYYWNWTNIWLDGRYGDMDIDMGDNREKEKDYKRKVERTKKKER